MEAGYNNNYDDIKHDDNDKHNNDDHPPMKTYQVGPELHNQRIDVILAALIEPNISRARCQMLLTEGRVFLRSPNTFDITDTSHTSHFQRVTHQSTPVPCCALLRVNFMISPLTPVSHNFPMMMTKSQQLPPPQFPIDVLFEDAHIIALNKRPGMVVHPSVGHLDGTLVDALTYYLNVMSPFGSGDLFGGIMDTEPDLDKDAYPDIESDTFALRSRPGIVHRLDKGTSGVLVVAKTRRAHAHLSAAFATRGAVRKTYVAITVGNPGTDVLLNQPISRHPVYRTKMRVILGNGDGNGYKYRSNRSPCNVRRGSVHPTFHGKSLLPVRKTQNSRKHVERLQLTYSPLINTTSLNARPAVSHVHTLAYDPQSKLALVQIHIVTGRTHQIRVHLQHHGTPIYGDDLYGTLRWNKSLRKTKRYGGVVVDRPLLHASQVELNHPITKEWMVVRAGWPEDLKKIAALATKQQVVN